MEKKYKPILFSTEMVQALDRKTLTRRTQGLEPLNNNADEWIFDRRVGNQFIFKAKNNDQLQWFLTPKFLEGNILWVRETFGYDHHQEDLSKVIVYKADNAETTLRTETETELPSGEIITKNRSFWHPSIHMPKEAARNFLEVVNVRCERLHDITEADAIAEGVYQHSDYGSTGYRHYGKPDEALTDIDAVWSFETLWESINGKDSWKANPWVWVYEFKVIEKPSVWPQ